MPELYDPDKQPKTGWAEGLILWLFPVPVALGAAGNLAVGNVDGLLHAVVACLFLAAGAWLTRDGLKAEREYQKRTVARAPRLPRKLLGMLAVALGTAAVASYDGYAAGVSIAFGIGAGLAMLFLYGLDPRGEKAPGDLAGVSTAAFAEAIETANRRLGDLDGLRKQVRTPQIQAKLQQMIGRARGVVQLIERDPACLPRARKFLNLYLDDAEQVTRKFVGVQPAARDPELERKFLESLETMDAVFAEQQDRLIRGNVLDLDVQLEVLTQRLKKEGVV